MLRTEKWKVSILLALLVMMLAAGGTALAQGPDQPAQPTPTPTPTPRTAVVERFWQALADHFHVTVDEIHNAVADAVATAVQPLVDDGKLSQEKVDAIVEKAREGKIAPFFMPHRQGQGRRFSPKTILHVERDMLKAAADELGMEPRALLGEIVGGKKLSQVVEEQSGDSDAVLSAMQEAANAAIDNAVSKGKVTQEQADKAKERIQSFLDQHGLDIGARYFAPPFRHRRGRGGGQGPSGRPNGDQGTQPHEGFPAPPAPQS